MTATEIRQNYIAQMGVNPICTDNELEEIASQHKEQPSMYSAIGEASLNNEQSIKSARISYAGY
jgi:hypothetical protein